MPPANPAAALNLPAMDFVPFGLGWMNFVVAMPLIVLATWICGLQADDYPELLKLGLVAMVSPLLGALLVLLPARAVSGGLDTSSASGSAVLLLLLLLSTSISAAILALACKRLVTLRWREAWLFGAIVAFGNFIVTLLLRLIQ